MPRRAKFNNQGYATELDVEHPFYFAPFQILRAPDLNLRLPRADPREINKWQVFAVLLLTYFLVTCGAIYDVIMEPQGIGDRIDALTGLRKPEVFSQSGVNTQYIIEGLSAGFMFCLGGSGFIFLDLAQDNNMASNFRMLYLVAGTVMIMGAYNICVLFLRIKLPNYLRL
jgi:hypothetical protein